MDRRSNKVILPPRVYLCGNCYPTGIIHPKYHLGPKDKRFKLGLRPLNVPARAAMSLQARSWAQLTGDCVSVTSLRATTLLGLPVDGRVAQLLKAKCGA